MSSILETFDLEYPQHLSVSSTPSSSEELELEVLPDFEGSLSTPFEGKPVSTERESTSRADGIEPVEGYLLPKPLAESLPVYNLPSDIDGLRDISEASFGVSPPLADTVHLPDDRIQITNTSIYPWRVHASLLIIAADNSRWIGTGWFIGPHTLMTAGHVVYIKNSHVPGRDGWVKSVSVMPGRNGDDLPYGSVTSTSFRSVTGWTVNGKPDWDYGAIIIPNNLGNTVGWFGFGVYSNSTLLSTVGNIVGYPGDKPSGTLWYDARRIASVTDRRVNYDIDTAPGQSGSAVYRIKENGGRYGFAIHAYGGSVTNFGTRIITPVYNNMLAWKT